MTGWCAMRNAEKDAIDMAAKREKMLEAGLCLFSEQAIEAVSMQDIANACGLGVATLYRYFNTKLSLVIAIGIRQWENYYREVEKLYAARGVGRMTAGDEFEFYLDCYIHLYKEHKDILRFNRNFVTYVRHEGATAEQMRTYNDIVNIFAKKFHIIYLKAEKDGTLMTDIPEDKLFVSTMHTMLSVAGKYAEGFIYPDNENRDMTEELIMLKNMILNTYTTKGLKKS